MKRKILIGICILSLVFLGGCLRSEQIGIVTDIVQVSAGGFATEIKCILEINGKKVVASGMGCRVNVGDTMCTNGFEYFKCGSNSCGY